MKDAFIIINGFEPGWNVREDDTRIPLGGSQFSQNITITERRGISPRKAEILIGAENSASTGVVSAFSLKKPGESNDILLKTYSDKIEYFNNHTESWALLYDGYTSGKRFGFRQMRVDEDPFDWMYFGNGFDSYSRWCGYESKITSALVGAETSIPVISTLWPEVYQSLTATSCTTTTITVANTPWANDIWNDFYVRITSGAETGKIMKITATTSSTITFGALAGLAGTPTFEIRLLAVPATGTLVYGTNKIAYTAVPTDSSFTVASATATAIDTALTIAPQTYPSNPKGNLFETLNDDMFVSGVMNKPNTVFRSGTADATDFTFSSPRSADEGDVVYFPYGGSGVTDIKRQEKTIYVFKPESIDALSYTQDESDISQIDPIKAGVSVGTKNLTWRLDDDIAFVTPDNRITTLGRVVLKDALPSTVDIAYPIRREIKRYDFTTNAAEEHINQCFIGCKSASDVAFNDRTIVWNKDYRTWEGFWNISASCFISHAGDIYYGDSYNPNLYKMNTVVNKTRGTDVFPMTSDWKSGWINGKGAGFYLNEISCLAVEGYMRANSVISFDLYKDFAGTPFQNLSLSGVLDEDLLDEEPSFTLLGGDPLGLEPLGTGSIIGDEDEDGLRHFIAFLQFPTTQLEYISVKVSSSGLGQAWEITRLGLNAVENVFENQPRIKSDN
jgi:hypothetical protein